MANRFDHLARAVDRAHNSEGGHLTAAQVLGDGRLPSNMHQQVYVGPGPLGVSLFASQPIRSGRTILRLSGPIITFDDAVKKGARECYPLQIAHDAYIDLIEPGCFANHSCAPNAGLVNDVDLVAMRDLAPGEEIRYDYSTTMDEESWTMECRCGSGQCRGVVTDFKLLPSGVRNTYLRLGMVQAFIALQHRWCR